MLTQKVTRTRKADHDLNLAVIVKINERAQHVLIPASYLGICTQEQGKRKTPCYFQRLLLKKDAWQIHRSKFPIYILIFLLLLWWHSPFQALTAFTMPRHLLLRPTGVTSGFLTFSFFPGVWFLTPRPTPISEDQVSEFIRSGDRVAQLSPWTLCRLSKAGKNSWELRKRHSKRGKRRKEQGWSTMTNSLSEHV
jgi:hypothetical protein